MFYTIIATILIFNTYIFAADTSPEDSSPDPYNYSPNPYFTREDANRSDATLPNAPKKPENTSENPEDYFGVRRIFFETEKKEQKILDAISINALNAAQTESKKQHNRLKKFMEEKEITWNEYVNLVIGRNTFANNGILEYTIGAFTESLKQSKFVLSNFSEQYDKAEEKALCNESKPRSSAKHLGHFIKGKIKKFLQNYKPTEDFFQLIKLGRYEIHKIIMHEIKLEIRKSLDSYFSENDHATEKENLRFAFYEIIDESLSDKDFEQTLQLMAIHGSSLPSIFSRGVSKK